MADSYEALQVAQVFVFAGVGLAALIHWLRRRSEPAAWIAATLGVLGVVSLAGRLLPDEPSSRPEVWFVKTLIAILALFPYFLYRFHDSLIPAKRWVRITAAVLTGATVIWALLLPDIPPQGEPQPAILRGWVILLAFQWVFLNSRVAYRLWRAGSGQPTVTRRRMRTIASGAATLAVLIAIGAVSPAGSEVTARQFVTTILGMFSAPLFLLGFAPPRGVVAAWRRRDDVALREAEIALIQAVTSEQVAELLLPKLSAFMGGGGAVLTDREGRVLGSHALSEKEAGSIRLRLHDERGPQETRTLERVQLERGWLAVVASPLAPYFGDEERKTLQAIGTLTDMALARAELLEREHQSLETMRDFVAIASHDLRTPIAVISGIGATVRQQWNRLNEEQRLDLVGRVESQASHLARLVEDLLTVSKIESGFIGSRPEQLQIASIVSEVLTELGDRSRPVDVDIPEGTVVTGDPDHCRRILRNYLTNAFNYGTDPIKVQVRPTNGWIELLVSDSGNGVPAEFAPRLFDKFARADKKTSRAIQGTGLGLSIVRGLAKAMGGDAFYEANRPSGAVFGVRLPRPNPARLS